MLSQCPNCGKELNLNQAQQDKVKQALTALPEGKTLKINCPLCKEPIHLRADGSAVENEQAAPPPPPPSSAVTKAAANPPEPPAPPDVSVLLEGEVGEGETVRDIPLAMVLMAAGESRDQVAAALGGLGYQPDFPEAAESAIERMRFVNFSAVVLDSRFEGGGLAASVFHQHMRNLAMASRRKIIYVLIGPDFHTLYDLEALALSANLAVNSKDLPRLPVILKKAKQDYQALFGPYLQALADHGKL